MFAGLLAAVVAAAPVKAVTAHFNGHWEFVRGRTDGRFAGASARSFHSGDVVDLAINGSAFRIYGVAGPNGGHAVVLIPNQPDATIDFYAPAKRPHALLYTSPRLGPGEHGAAVIVAGTHGPRATGAYVNIDTVEVIP